MQTSTPHQAETTPRTETTHRRRPSPWLTLLSAFSAARCCRTAATNPVSLLFCVATAVLFAVVLLAGDAPTQTLPVSLLLLS
jgi:hypothetical protein